MEGQVAIKDRRPLRAYEGGVFPYHYDLRGNLIASNVNLSGNINMTGGSISWANDGNEHTVQVKLAHWQPVREEITSHCLTLLML
ncbi:hypothetical protein ABEW34_01355 [Paenibacillus algorifonticola]|uniref:hypothetical protein n=1 Tax=Paenibacillus algorifonticola TaxID=684063 RepID=UPI003D2809B2